MNDDFDYHAFVTARLDEVRMTIDKWDEATAINFASYCLAQFLAEGT